MKRRVLLLVDVQDGFFKAGMSHVVPNIQKHMREEKFDLILQSRWVNHMGSRYERDLGYTDVGNSTQARFLIQTDSPYVIERCQYSCVTPLFESVVDKENDTVYVAGVDTDACVLATLFDLWDKGYRFHVYEDSVSTPVKALRNSTLQLIKRNFGKGCLV